MYSRAIDTRKKPDEKLPRSQRGITRPSSASATAAATPASAAAARQPGRRREQHRRQRQVEEHGDVDALLEAEAGQHEEPRQERPDDRAHRVQRVGVADVVADGVEAARRHPQVSGKTPPISSVAGSTVMQASTN